MRSRHACSWLILQGLKRRREKKQLSSFWNRVQIRAGVFLTVITGLTCRISMLPCCLSTAIVPPGHVIVLMGCNVGSSVRRDSERSLRGQGRRPGRPNFSRRVNHHH